MAVQKLKNKAIKSGAPADYIKVAEAYEYGKGCKVNLKAARNWYKKAVDKNDASAAYQLALLHRDDWESEDHQELAHKYFKLAAKLGLVKAMNNLAWTYYYGDGIECSLENAMHWFEEAVSNGDHSNLIQLVEIYMDNYSSHYSPTLAKKWIREIVASKDAQIIFELAYIFNWGDGDSESEKEAFKYIKKASELGCAEADIELAVAYFTGNGIKKNLKRSNDVLTKIFQSKDYNTISQIADMHDRGNIFPCNPEESFRWHKRAAQLGDDYSQMIVGRRYRDGKGVRKSYRNAVSWLKRSAEQRNGSACFSLGYLYKKRDWKDKDDSKSFSYLKLAHKYGVTNAFSAIGWAYQEGIGVRQSNKTAIKWFKKGIEAFDNRSEYGLGYMYLHGLGCKKDYVKAYKHNKKSAENGFAHAMQNCGWLLECGLGVKKSIEEAIHWYEKGAKKNHPGCLGNLAFLYLNGKGVEKNGKKAFSLFKEAASLGDATAQFNLGVEYALSDHVKKNCASAKKNWNMSVENPNVYLNPAYYYRYALGHIDGTCGLKPQKAVYWLEQSLNKGYKEAAAKLGDLYREGTIVKPDAALSKKYYKIAFNYYKSEYAIGNSAKLNELADMYNHGRGTKKNQVKAKECFEEARKQKVISRKNNYAWLLSTSKNQRLRDSKLALKLIRQVIKDFGEKAIFIDTMAAAYAESGNFKKAVDLQKKSIKLLDKNHRDVEEFNERLELYRNRKAWSQ